ncbi:hypothetical protein DPMN_005985 [Dreissena polymorpha]|uniref:Uncharacterized protein n=1 Tax=Dreissena polymorpha TaxID=45954 RepID=A0A9D4MTQ8_DREPO|nr:hypothetical protein DPMN_005985 [Dreissena polymorpha]
MIPRRQYDMTIALSPPYYRTAAIVLSHCRIVVIVLARFRNRDRLYIITSYWLQHKLLTLARDGTLLATYSDPALESPLGLHVTPAGQVLVCGRWSYTVLQVGWEGESKLATLASQKDGVWRPLSCVHWLLSQDNDAEDVVDKNNLNTQKSVQGLNAWTKCMCVKCGTKCTCVKCGTKCTCVKCGTKCMCVKCGTKCMCVKCGTKCMCTVQGLNAWTKCMSSAQELNAWTKCMCVNCGTKCMCVKCGTKCMCVKCGTKCMCVKCGTKCMCVKCGTKFELSVSQSVSMSVYPAVRKKK